MNNTNDFELLMLAQENNEEAINILFQKYEVLIRSIIKHYEPYSKVFKIDEKDLYSVSLDKLICAINSYNDKRGANFKTYAILVIKRGILKYILRSNKNDYKTESIEDISFGADFVDITGEPSKKIETDEILDEINYIIENDFSHLERQVVNMLISGMDYKSIAQELNKDAKQIYNAINRIRSKLRLRLENA